MAYFLSHIGYIVIAAVILAVVAFLTVIMAEKNEAERRKEMGENQSQSESCDFNCGSCSLRDNCETHKK